MMDDREFMLHANSLNAIMGTLLQEARSGSVAHALIRCIHHLSVQNAMLYNELKRREDEELRHTNCIVEEREDD